MTKKIYLAGFDVFRQDARSYGDDLKAMCARYGFEGLFPLDNEAPPELRHEKLAAWIYRSNVEAIRSADLVMANLDDFRAPGEPDSGTAWEVGFAVALDKPVWGYLPDALDLLGRVQIGGTSLDGQSLDDQGYLIEDFGLPLNLMLACSVTLTYGGPRECLNTIRAHYANYG